jgi:non-specific serine/threonine protein kinase
LSQERLAERAGISAQALSALENGRRQAPYRHTVALLARAMGLAEADAAALEAAVVRARWPTPSAASPAGVQEQKTTPAQVTDVEASPLGGASQPARTNLPEQLTSFIGRERAQAEVRALLGRAPLVTLTGAGGVGKTRLAFAVARGVLSEYPDGVWLVDLAPLADLALVAQTVAQTLGLQDEVSRPILATLIDHLKGRQLLLVLDNCEHLLAACADLASALLRTCPGVRMLATSREGLGVTAEHRYRVPSLSMPDRRHPQPLELVGSYEAVRLFVARAQARRQDFALAKENARAVAAVCARLDGIPLAIELAAARVDSLPVEAIAERLDQRFRLLTSGPRDAPSRQQTLRAALDWSWDLLTGPEQQVLRRLSVFAGGWTLAAAEAVCAGEDYPHVGTRGWEILDLLEGLLNKSLAHLEEGDEETRYGLLETVRQFAEEHLQASGEAAAIRERHLAYYVALAEEAEPQLRGAREAEWLVRLQREHDNLRAALAWSLQGTAAGETGLRLAAALEWFWLARDSLAEGATWLMQLLAMPAAVPGRPRVNALVAAAVGMIARGDTATAHALLEEALALARQLHDRSAIANTLLRVGWLATIQGDYPEARSQLEEALALFGALADRWGATEALCQLGRVIARAGEPALARPVVDAALATARGTGNPRHLAYALQVGGEVAFALGDYAEAQRLWEGSLAGHHQLGDNGAVMGMAELENYLGLLAIRLGDHATARFWYQASLEHQRGWRALYWAVCSLAGLAAVAAGTGQAARALRLAGASLTLGAAAKLRLTEPEQQAVEQAIHAARASLEHRAAEAAWTEGQAMTLERAVAYAVEAV